MKTASQMYNTITNSTQTAIIDEMLLVCEKYVDIAAKQFKFNTSEYTDDILSGFGLIFKKYNINDYNVTEGLFNVIKHMLNKLGYIFEIHRQSFNRYVIDWSNPTC